MTDRKDSSKHLMFLEPVSKDTDTEELVERLVLKLESLSFKIIGKDKETKDES